VRNEPSTPKHGYLRVMAIESLVDLNKTIIPDQEKDVMHEVPKDGHAGCGMKELDNHLIHTFAPNINAMEEQ
jgi:hypothetical protein